MIGEKLFGDIVVLTGAGISKESGIDTFRDKGGLWTRVNLEDVATPEGFARNPVMVQEFYNERRRGLRSDNIRANAAHDALARLEKEWPGEVLIVTQNIDNLHEAAGSSNLIHMHGEMFKARCEGCGAVHDWLEDITLETLCPGCDRPGAMRPHVVWFGEMPFEMERIYEALSRCRLFLSIGTSGNVYPAAGFVQEATFRARAHTVELNMEPSEGATLFREAHYGPATQVVPRYVDKILTEGLVTSPEDDFARLLAEVRACTRCAAHLPLGPRPVVRMEATARLLVIGQAPGTKVHASGLPFDDPSGDRLRGWLGIDRDTFYDASRIAIMPMGFCYPGTYARGGDLPPRPECAPAWHDLLLAHLPKLELILLVGAYSQARYLGEAAEKTLTATVARWRDFLPRYLPTPHPSWRTLNWAKKNPWFEAELVPELQQRVKALL